MPNQVETIELTVDDRPAVQGADRANARLEQFEKTGARAAQSTSKAFEDVGATVVRFADRSASGMERSLASLQRRLAQFSSPAERLASERVAALPRFAGDEERLRRATELYDQLAAAQKRADNTALLERAQRASRAAEGATSAFQVALSRSNAERQREAKLAEQESRAIEGQVRQIERSRALSDAGAVDRLRLQRKFALEDLGPKASPEQVARVQRAFQSAIEAEEKLGEAAGLKGFGDRLRGFVEDPLGSARNLLQSVFGGITAGGLAAAAGLAVLATAAEKAFGIVADAGKKAETSLNLAERLGTTVAEAQTLSAVARITSVDIGSVESSVKKLSSALAEGGNEGKQGADALKSIGVFARDSQGNLKGFYQLFGQIADGIDKLPDHAQKVSVLENLFGKGAVSMLPMIRNFRELEEEARRLGLTLDEDLVRRLGKADDTIDKLGLAWDALKARFAGRLEPIVIPLVIEATNILGKSPTEILKNEFDNTIGNPFLNPIALAIQHIKADLADVKPKAVSATAAVATLSKSEVNFEDQRRAQVLRAQFEARSTLDSLKREIDDKDKDLREAQAKLDQLPKDASSAVVASTIRTIEALRSEDDALKLKAKVLSELPDRQKQARDAALEADAAELSGISKILAERQRQIDQISTFSEHGQTVRIDLAKQAPDILASIEASTQAKIRAEQRKTQQELAELSQKTAESVAAGERATLGEREAAEERFNERRLASGAISLRELENARLQLHVETLNKIAELDRRQAAAQFDLQIGQLKKQRDLATAPEDKQTFSARIRELEAQREQAIKGVNDRVSAASAASAEDLDNLRIRRDREFSDRTKSLQFDNIEAIGQAQQRALEHARDSQLEALALVDTQTLSGKLSVEARKFEIESQFLRLSETLQRESLDRRLKRELDLLDIQARAEGISDEEAAKRRLEIEEQFQIQRQGIAEDANAAIAASATRAAAAQLEAIRSQTRSVFDTFKRESEGVFDALLTKSKNIFQAIGDSLKNALLTAIKDAVSSRVAASLTQIFTGQRVRLQTENTGGILGGIRQALGIGATPVITPSQQLRIQTKLDQPNHLGDVLLAGGAVPVVVANPIQFARSGSGLPFAIGGATAALAAALGLGALAAPTQAASSVPAGVVQSTINFGSGESFTGAPQVFGAGSVLGGPGGTPGFSGPVTGGTFPGVPSTPPFVPAQTAQHAGILGSLKDSLSGLKGILSGLGNIGLPGVSSLPVGIGGDTAAQAAGIPGLGSIAPLKSGSFLGNIFGGSHAIGGTLGGALLAGGGLLFAHGLQQGGVSGLLQTTAGGAAIGLKFGGPIGGLIGAGVGAVAGLFGLFRQSAEEKIQKKVKEIYKIDIDKKFAKDPLFGIIKQNFGGNIDVGVRSPQVRELLELYAMSTGQNFAGIVPRVQAVTFANQGGQLTRLPNIVNGQAQPFTGGSAIGNGVVSAVSAGSVQSPAPVIAGATAITLQLDPAATKAVLEGRAAEALKNNPRAVSQAAVSGQRASSGRRESAVLALQPNRITA